jgi:hypothetical protein
MESSKPGHRPQLQVDDPLRDATNLELRAERLVAEYLRMWGLRDPQTVATLSRRWVRSAGADSAIASGSLTELYRAIMRRAIGEMQKWLDRLTGEVCSGSHETRSRRGLLAIELQAIVDQYPAALLGDGSLPGPLLARLASAALPVVPVCHPTHMPTQSLEAVSSSAYFSRWNQAWTCLGHRLRRTVSFARDVF